MAGNRGKTSLKCRKRSRPRLRDFDSLPPELRVWIAGAELPWRPGSVRKAYEKAIAKVGDRDAALRELDRLEAALIAKDAANVWGTAHPEALRRAA
ncbi:MAG: DUF6525 family protein [Pseudomonadota bacterium]